MVLGVPGPAGPAKIRARKEEACGSTFTTSGAPGEAVAGQAVHTHADQRGATKQTLRRALPGTEERTSQCMRLLSAQVVGEALVRVGLLRAAGARGLHRRPHHALAEPPDQHRGCHPSQRRVVHLVRAPQGGSLTVLQTALTWCRKLLQFEAHRSLQSKDQ